MFLKLHANCGKPMRSNFEKMRTSLSFKYHSLLSFFPEKNRNTWRKSRKWKKTSENKPFYWSSVI